MKQIELAKPGEFREREVPAISAEPGHALVRIEKVGVCGSDFHAFAGRHPIYTYPRVLGHELSGIVVSVPPGSTRVSVGDRCAIDPYISCGRCRACTAGLINACEHIQLFGVHIDGGMQEYLSVPLHLLHTSKVLSLDQLALVETLGIGAHAVMRSGLKAGEDALVVGAGPIGISVAVFARIAGSRVRVIEKNSSRRAFVKRQGCVSLSEWDGEVADVVFDATGSAAAMAKSLEYAAVGGRLVYVGLTSDPILLDDSLFHRRELTLLASRNSREQFPRIIRLMEDGILDTSDWITDRLNLLDVPAHFAELTERQSLIKAMIDVHEKAL